MVFKKTRYSILTMDERTRKTAHNCNYKKLAIQWSNEALRFLSSFLVVNPEVSGLRNRHLFVVAQR